MTGEQAGDLLPAETPDEHAPISSQGLIAPELALDLGTALTRLTSRDAPMLIERSSALESASDTDGTLAREHHLQHPVQHGVVVDVDAAARMLAPHIRAGRGHSPSKPRVLVCHPSDASPEERGRLVTAVLMAGAGAVRLASEPVAAVLGGGPQSMRPRMVIDFGEGVTDLAVVQGEQALASTTLRIGLAEIRQLVQQAVFEEHHFSLHPEEIASLLTQRADLRDWLPVRRAPRRRERERAAGRRVLARLLFVRNAVVADALKGALDLVAQSAASLRSSLAGRDTDAVARDGILLSGGGALVPHLRLGIAQRLALEVGIAPDPLHAVIEGARRLLRSGGQVEWLMGDDLSLPSPALP